MERDFLDGQMSVENNVFKAVACRKVSLITCQVSDNIIARAKGFRAKRDLQYGNLFKEKETDRRWIGDMGEKYFHLWCKALVAIRSRTEVLRPGA